MKPATFSTNSVRDFTSSLLPLWITDASIVLPSLTRRLVLSKRGTNKRLKRAE